MAKEVKARIKLQCPGGQATPAPPVGPALGQHGVNIGEFVRRFNDATSKDRGTIIPVVLTEALPETPAFTDACNGDRALCDRRLDEVVFPGAHNSMSAAEFEGWMFPNQELGSVSALGHGMVAAELSRYFLAR